MKITEETTLGELALIRAKLGSPLVSLMTCGDQSSERRVVYMPQVGMYTGQGATEAIALSRAFEGLERGIAEQILGSHPGARP